MFGRLLDRDRLPKLRVGAYKETHFELKIERPTRSKLAGCQLAAGPGDIGPTDDQRTGATVVGDRQVEPILLQGVLRAAEHGAHVGGVISRRVKIGVVRYLDWQQHLAGVPRQQHLVAEGAVVAEFSAPRAQRIAESCADPLPGRTAEVEKGVE